MESFRLYSGIPSLPDGKVWAEINTQALADNYRILCKKTPGIRHICVVKADAYGHTSAICVDALLDADCDFFAVSCIEEAIEVRKLCRAKNRFAEILILGYTDPQYAKALAEYNIIQAVVGEDHAEALLKKAKSEKCTVRVHVALDTGMNRVGLCARNENECMRAADTVKALAAEKHLSIEGLFTHFSKADEEEASVFAPESHTRIQAKRFAAVQDLLKNSGIELFCHACNSAAAIRFPEYAFDGVRLGILLYGVRPSRHVAAETAPVMSLHTVISHIHELPAGESVSYGGRYVAESDLVIATLPIGYADGFLRAYEGAEVTVHSRTGDRKAPIIGRICMDQCMIDLTGISAEVGDRVTVFGDDHETLSALAALANTIEYEVICLISGRVPRIAANRKTQERRSE